MQKILITGATGFVGQHLCTHLLRKNFSIRVAVRKPVNYPLIEDTLIMDSFGPDTDWSVALDSVDTVIHLAACAHRTDKQSETEQFDLINNRSTNNLALQAVKANVKRFIFISSVKVYGETVATDSPLTEKSDVGIDCDAYGYSKLAAEKSIMKAAADSSMVFVIIRSPLVYGPGVAANFRSLIKLSATGIPLPFLAINNKRSMIAIDNLIDFITCCINGQAAANQILLVSDNADVSLPGLIRLIRKAQGSSPGLFGFPISLLKFFAWILGRSGQLAKLTDSIQLDINKAMKTMDWQPVISMQATINKTVKVYKKS